MSFKSPKKVRVEELEQIAAGIVGGKSITKALEDSDPFPNSPKAIERLATRVESTPQGHSGGADPAHSKGIPGSAITPRSATGLYAHQLV